MNGVAYPDRITITGYHPRYRADFEALNRAWIERHFRVEAADRKMFDDPEGTIVNRGGAIFFLLVDGWVRGTCALVPAGEGVYELAKMAVAPEARGRGHGARLMKAALDWARNHDARSIFLLSNTVLAPALRLYERFGFRTVRRGPHPDYDRADIEMALDL